MAAVSGTSRHLLVASRRVADRSRTAASRGRTCARSGCLRCSFRLPRTSPRWNCQRRAAGARRWPVASHLLRGVRRPRPVHPNTREYNFSPSGAWAAYQFTGYRAGMRPIVEAARRSTPRNRAADSTLAASAGSRWLRCPRRDGLRLGCRAVIEDRDGALSYWALRHPSEKPDFHNADRFRALE